MSDCTIPQLDYGLPSLSTSRLLNSIDQYYEYNILLLGTGQPNLGPTIDILENLMLRSPGMDEYKTIHFGNAPLTASQWIGLIEVFFKNVSYTIALVTGLAERR